MRRSLRMLLIAVGVMGLRVEEPLLAQATSPGVVPPPASGGSYLPPTIWKDLDGFYDRVQLAKVANGVPLSFGAWHWWHADRGGSFHYGTKDASGTFFFFVTADPLKTVATGPVKSFGAHVELRANDGDKFRSFFPSQLWTYDSYLWAYTDFGTFKAGQIWKRVGLDWDDSFWGGTAYFDGFKLNPDWGVSWEKQSPINSRLSIDTYAQFFVHEDGINGALGFADPESVPQFSARNTAVLRGVFKYKLSESFRIEAGISGQAGVISSRRFDIGNQRQRSVAFDLGGRYTFRRDLELRLFGEWLNHRGAISPYRYVSGGASDRIVDTMLGAQLRHGPITYRTEISTGRDYRPDGRQKIHINGVTLALAKNADLYIERVKWTVRPAYLTSDLIFNNGWEVVLTWRL